jgi:hypothetical protein
MPDSRSVKAVYGGGGHTHKYIYSKFYIESSIMYTHQTIKSQILELPTPEPPFLLAGKKPIRN